MPEPTDPPAVSETRGPEPAGPAVGVDLSASSGSGGSGASEGAAGAGASSAGASGLPVGGRSDTAAGLSASGSVSGSAAGSSLGPGHKVHATFAAEELAVVLSHFDLGVIESVQAFPRGSRKAPKLLIRAESGPYLLKRRAASKADPYKVAFSHGLQLHLADRGFPLPRLVGTKRDNNSMLRHEGAIYELFEFVKGSGYDGSLEATHDAGKTLALFHKLLRDYESQYAASRGSYHASKSVRASLAKMPTTLMQVADETMHREAAAVRDATAYLQETYERAAAKASGLGLETWAAAIVHGDWHPGNMLFRGSRVAGVIDYDTARVQPRALDVGNGALQFSILGGSDDPTTWPDYLDESRLKRFVRGYESVPDMLLSKAEVRCLPWLMTEALIAEMTIPIANTGHFGRIPGGAMLLMVERKVRWLEHKIESIVEMLAS